MTEHRPAVGQLIQARRLYLRMLSADRQSPRHWSTQISTTLGRSTAELSGGVAG